MARLAVVVLVAFVFATTSAKSEPGEFKHVKAGKPIYKDFAYVAVPEVNALSKIDKLLVPTEVLFVKRQRVENGANYQIFVMFGDTECPKFKYLQTPKKCKALEGNSSPVELILYRSRAGDVTVKEVIPVPE